MSKDGSTQVKRHDVAMTDDELADFYLAERRMQCLRRQLFNSRRFVTLPKELLAAQWVDAYRAFASAPPDEPLPLSIVVSLQCELEMREIEPPRHLVTAERTRFKDHVERLWLDSRPDPVAWMQVHAELAVLRVLVAKRDF